MQFYKLYILLNSETFLYLCHTCVTELEKIEMELEIKWNNFELWVIINIKVSVTQWDRKNEKFLKLSVLSLVYLLRLNWVVQHGSF